MPSLTKGEAAMLGRRRQRPTLAPGEVLAVTSAVSAPRAPDPLAEGIRVGLARWPAPVKAANILASCEIDGDPMSKQRPRFVRKSGTVFTPRETRERERTIGLVVKASMRELLRDRWHAFGLRVVFRVATNQRKDIDNMVKLVCDGLNGVVWEDDSQLKELMAWVMPADRLEPPKTILLVYRIPEMCGGRPTLRHCLVCRRPFHAPPAKAKRFCSLTCSAAAQRRRAPATCGHCGKGFHATPANPREFCSVACKHAAGRVEFVCAECGNTFALQRNVAARRLPTWEPACGRACASRHARRMAGTPYGKCRICGAGTSRLEYDRCNACRLGGRQ